MKVLVTGATGFIGRHLILELQKQGHDVVTLTRDSCDLTKQEPNLPHDLDAAYYLVHGMSRKHTSLMEVEQQQVEHFIAGIKKTNCRHLIYLGGLAPGEIVSNHLRSRLNVEAHLKKCGVPVTIFRASIIVGEGSTSFEMIRYLTERLPIMVTPKWVNHRSQPISINDVIFYLTASIGNNKCANQTFDIGGPDILTFSQMIQLYAKVRGLKRHIFSVPWIALKPSYLWVTLFSPANRYLAKSLVHSLRQEFICSEKCIHKTLPHKCQSYEESITSALKIFPIPEHGVSRCETIVPFQKSKEAVLDSLWQIGGKKKWYYMNWVWKLRGKIDRLLGGVGFQIGRSPEIKEGETLDFWKVLESNKDKISMVLFAKMLMPGEAWLHFSIFSEKDHYALKISAIFRPKGLAGRLYWSILYPIHVLIFRGMANSIIKKA